MRNDGLATKAITVDPEILASNTFTFGDGADTDKTIIADNGDGNLPELFYDASTNAWSVKNDGLTTQSIVVDAAPAFNINSISTSQTVAINDYVKATNTINATLPTAVGGVGKPIVVNNDGTGIITVLTTSAQTIGHSSVTSLRVFPGGILHVISDDANWQVVSAELNWHVNVELGGANFNIPTVIQANYTEIIDAGLDMIVLSGDTNVEVPCSTTNPPTGLTCSSGSESLGISFTNQRPGNYEVCFAGVIGAQITPYVSIKLIETPINAQTLLQETGGFQAIRSRDASDEWAYHMCALFEFTTSTKRVVRLMHEKDSAAAVNLVQADRNGAKGQRVLTFTVMRLQ